MPFQPTFSNSDLISFFKEINDNILYYKDDIKEFKDLNILGELNYIDVQKDEFFEKLIL